MGLLRGFFAVPLVVLVLAFTVNWYIQSNNQKLLKNLEDWGEQNKINVNGLKAEKFEIQYDEAQWNSLVNKLNSTRYFDPIDEKYAKRYEFGFDVDYAKELVQYWQTKFNWKKQIERINRFPQYRIVLDNTILHFMHVNEYQAPKDSAKSSKRIPLLLLSGWPGSFFEFYKTIDLIHKKYNNKNRHFDIVVPSIPGFAYSSPLTKPNDVVDTARVYDALMRHLYGEDCEYFIHSEDWGSVISFAMAQLYPKRVSGVHTSMVSPTKGSGLEQLFYAAAVQLVPGFMLTEEEKESKLIFTPLKRFSELISKTGYFHIQSTKPDTLGFAFSDSPVGLLTYILEKYAFGSFNYYDVVDRRDGSLEKYDRDELLTIVTVYWMTNTITSSMRIYKWVMLKFSKDVGFPKNKIDNLPTPATVPIAVMYPRYDVDRTPYCLLKRFFGNLQQYNILKTGGHFIAFQEPELTLTDLTKFIDNNL